MIKVGIIGGAGYTAGELIRLLINHPEAEIVFINSSSNAGNKLPTYMKDCTAKRTLSSPTSYLWTKLTCYSSVPPMATRRSSWRVTTFPRN